jgi:hypothetical protein
MAVRYTPTGRVSTSQNLNGKITTELIKLRSGSFIGKQRVTLALLDVKHFWTEEMQELVKSRYDENNIPFRTGAMFRSHRRELMRSPEGSLLLGAPRILYAAFVDAMVPKINWTGGGNRYNWFRKIYVLVETWKTVMLRRAIRRAGLASAANVTVAKATTEMNPL